MKLKYTKAEAKVACPHKSISHDGSNHLIQYSPDSFFINAVSDKLFSLAIFCIKTLSLISENITAAGFPENNLSANASI